jgi:hypothetical protein
LLQSDAESGRRTRSELVGCHSIAADVRLLASDLTIKQRLSELGMVARGSTPTEYAAMLAEQSANWAAFARMHGVRPQP